jgi:hypothetical protein
MEQCSYLTCNEIDGLTDLMESIKIRKEIFVKISDEESVLHCLMYKLVYFSSKLSVIETLNYQKRHPEITNIFQIKEKYDKYIFDNLLCFIYSIENLILCIKKNEGEEKAKEVLNFIINSLLGSISNFLYEPEKYTSIEDVNKFFISQVQQFLQISNPNCRDDFYKNLEKCGTELNESYSDLDKPITKNDEKKFDSKTLSIIRDYKLDQTVYVVEKDKKVDIYTIIEDKAATLPEYTIDTCKRLATTICNACYRVRGYVPRPVKCAFNVMYSLMKTIIPFVPVALLTTQTLFLTGNLISMTPSTKTMLTNSIVVLENTKKILPSFINTGNMAQILSTDASELDVQSRKNLLKEQQSALMSIFKKASSAVNTEYKKQIKDEAKRQKLLKDTEQELQREKILLEKQTALIDYTFAIKYKEQEAKIESILEFIISKIKNLNTLKDEYGNIQQSVLFFKELNDQQKNNLNNQSKIIREIRLQTKQILVEMKGLNVDSPLYQKCLDILEDVKETSRLYGLGIEEVYFFFNEEMNEEKTGWSYDILNKINTFFPRIMNKRTRDAITNIASPAEKIGAKEITLTALSVLPLLKFRGVSANANSLLNKIKIQARAKGWITKTGRTPKAPEFKSVDIQVRGGFGGVLAASGFLAFNAYQYGNLIEKQIKKVELLI